MLWSRLTVPLHRYAAFYIFIFVRIGCHYHPLGTDEPSWETTKKKRVEKKIARGSKSEIEMLNNDAYKTQRNTNTKRRRYNALSLLLAQTHRYGQTHRHTNTQRDDSTVTGHG